MALGAILDGYSGARPERLVIVIERMTDVYPDGRMAGFVEIIHKLHTLG